MPTPKELEAECSALYEQAESVLKGIDRLARDFSERGLWIREREALDSLASLRLNLSHLTERIDQIKADSLRFGSSSSVGAQDSSVTYLVGGIAAGVLLGKLLGSKSQVDLLPFLTGWELASELTQS